MSMIEGQKVRPMVVDSVTLGSGAFDCSECLACPGTLQGLSIAAQ